MIGVSNYSMYVDLYVMIVVAMHVDRNMHIICCCLAVLCRYTLIHVCMIVSMKLDGFRSDGITNIITYITLAHLCSEL